MPWSLSEMLFSMFWVCFGSAGLAYKDQYLNFNLVAPIFSSIFDALCIILISVFLMFFVHSIYAACQEWGH